MAFALPGYGGLRRSGRTSVQDKLAAEKPIICFSGRKTRTISTFARRSRARIDLFAFNSLAAWERKRIRFNGDISPVRFISTTEHRIARAILERDRAGAMNELAGLETFVSFLHFLPLKIVPYCSYPTNTKINKTTTVPLYMTSTYNSKTAVQYRMTPIYNSTLTTVQYRTFTDPLL